MLRAVNLDGDGQADLVNHGGVDRAVYTYPVENYDYWGRKLVRDDLSFGQFGDVLPRGSTIRKDGARNARATGDRR